MLFNKTYRLLAECLFYAATWADVSSVNGVSRIRGLPRRGSSSSSIASTEAGVKCRSRFVPLSDEGAESAAPSEGELPCIVLRLVMSPPKRPVDEALVFIPEFGKVLGLCIC